MTDQQKKAVEEAAEAQPLGVTGFKRGAEEVISNPEKYGLVPYKKIAIKELKDYDKDFLIQVIFKERGEYQDKKEKDLEFLIEMQDRFNKARDRKDVTQFEYVGEMMEHWIDELKGGEGE